MHMLYKYETAIEKKALGRSSITFKGCTFLLTFFLTTPNIVTASWGMTPSVLSNPKSFTKCWFSKRPKRIQQFWWTCQTFISAILAFAILAFAILALP